MSAIPSLPHGCGSWIVVDQFGRAICEIFRSDKAIAERINQAMFIVAPAGDYLAARNGSYGHSIADLAWQLLHMDWPHDEPATFADAARVFDELAREAA